MQNEVGKRLASVEHSAESLRQETLRRKQVVSS
jgi:hypothetical protein